MAEYGDGVCLPISGYKVTVAFDLVACSQIFVLGKQLTSDEEPYGEAHIRTWAS